jgi:hypothetical protein
MTMMFGRSLVLIGLMVLGACAGQTAYQPAEKRGAEGYTETRLGGNRYRVTFTGNSVTPAETVKDYALLRAAEVTLREGGDWFQIAHQETDRRQQSASTVEPGLDFPASTAVYQHCGLLSCSTAITSTPGFDSGAGVASTTTSIQYSSSIEFLTGKYPMPKTVESYDARQLDSALRPLVNKAR